VSTPHPTSVTQGTQFATAYPFAKPSDDVRGLLTDFYLCYEDPGCVVTLPLRVDWLHGLGSAVAAPPPGTPAPVNPVEVLVKDAAGYVVFDSTEATQFYVQPWGGRSVVEWLTTYGVCRLVVQDVDPTLWPADLRPAAGELDGRTYHSLPRRVLSLGAEGVFFAPGAVEIDNGFNVDVQADEQPRVDGGRRVTQIVFTIEPGLGAGTAPGCGVEAEVLVRTINGVGPDAGGNFVLDAYECFRLQLPLTVDGVTATYGTPDLDPETARHAVLVANDCVPCCECSDYVNVYKGLTGTWNAWKRAAELLEKVRDDFAANRTRWQAAVACARENPLRLRLLADKACAAQVSASYCNNTGTCVKPLTMTFDFSGATGGTVVEAQAEGRGPRDKVTLDGTWPNFSYTFAEAEPYAASWVNFRVCMSGCTDGQAIEVTLGASGQQATATSSVPLTTAQPDYGCGCAAQAPPSDGRLTPIYESPAGTLDGSNGSFTLSHPADPAETLQVFRNGVLQALGIDYDVSGTTLTFTPGNVPQPGDILITYYLMRT
jgi:hypothetical protein